MNISKYISYIEATKSDTAIRKGIENIPNPEQLAAMRYVGKEIFDKVREWIKGPLHANSFFRSPELNVAIGGAQHSQHCHGEAIDIDADKYGVSSNKEIFEYIKNNLDFDQLIFEGIKSDGDAEWIHCSKVDEKVKGRKNRKEVLYAKFVDGKAVYTHAP